MSTSFDWDVFLSHSSVKNEKPRVARLAERLKAAGFRVWFDRPNIDSGEDIVTAIEQGLERSRVLVLCMTKPRSSPSGCGWNGTRPRSAIPAAASCRCG